MIVTTSEDQLRVLLDTSPIAFVVLKSNGVSATGFNSPVGISPSRQGEAVGMDGELVSHVCLRPAD